MQYVYKQKSSFQTFERDLQSSRPQNFDKSTESDFNFVSYKFPYNTSYQ